MPPFPGPYYRAHHFKMHLNEADVNPIRFTLPAGTSMMIFKMQKKMSKYFVPWLRIHLGERREKMHNTLSGHSRNNYKVCQTTENGASTKLKEKSMSCVKMAFSLTHFTKQVSKIKLHLPAQSRHIQAWQSSHYPCGSSLAFLVRH